MKSKKYKFAIASDNCHSYLTAGKKYEIEWTDRYCFHITDDEGDSITCSENGCAHLRLDDWKFTNK